MLTYSMHTVVLVQQRLKQGGAAAQHADDEDGSSLIWEAVG